jgi:hypothetical protein
MALVPKEIDDRITALEESNASLEERLALVEEALAPRIVDIEVHDEMMNTYIFEEEEDVDSNIG